MSDKKLSVYELNRFFWDFAFDNPDLIKPNHCAIYYFAVEQCNRLGWKEKFGLPASLVMEATGIKSYSVYKKTFDDLVDFGMIKVVEYSKNQYSSNIIALKENYKAHLKATNKALDKALSSHITKQAESTFESTESIIRPITNIQDTNIPTTNLHIVEEVNTSSKKTKKTIEERKNIFYEKVAEFKNEFPKEMLRDFFEYWTERGDSDLKMRFEKEKTFSTAQRLKRWSNNNFNNSKNGNGKTRQIGGVIITEEYANDLQRRMLELE